VFQIASRLVERVQSDLGVGETPSAGQRPGMIRFGWHAAIGFADREDVQIEASSGDNVNAGISVLARYRADGGAET
jgi:hypothetical protein